MPTIFSRDDKFLLRLPVNALDLPELSLDAPDWEYHRRAMQIGYGSLGTDVRALLMVLNAIPCSLREKLDLIH